MSFDYFYGTQADMFSFFRIPKVLFTDKRFGSLSIGAKVLYGLLLDRMGLSACNGWLDTQRRVYIVFSIDEICDTLVISKKTAIKYMAELDTKDGIGLIERIRLGQGRADRIYVLNFIGDGKGGGGSDKGGDDANKLLAREKEHLLARNEKSVRACGNEPELSNALSVQSTPQENVKPLDGGFRGFQKCKMYTSKTSAKSTVSEVEKVHPNNTEINNTHTLSISHISQSSFSNTSMPVHERTTDMIAQEYESIRADVAEQIEADTLKEEHGETIDEIVEVITDVMTSQSPTIRIDGADRPTEVLRIQFARLTAAHVEAALWNLRKHAPEPVANVRAYMRALLLDALFTLHLRIATAGVV